MAKYRKVDPRIWNDAKFRDLSDNGKLAFFFLLTHPHMTALGAMRSTIPGLASEMGWTLEAFQKAFQEALEKGMAKHDPKACFVWLPKFLRYNGPESPNVVKAWAGALDYLPECRLKSEVIQDVKVFAEALPEGFTKALPEAFAKSMPYQEQEQEQEQEEKNGADAPTIWDLGEGLFGKRSYVTKLIKDHGEEPVVQAIAKLAAMKNPPNDPKSYVQGMLKDKKNDIFAGAIA